MSNIGVTYNNPGNLTVNGPSSISYPGQTGVYSSPNGYNYAVFGTPEAGSNALVGWLQNNIGTDPSNSLSSVNSVLGYYLNGSYDGVTNTNANPHATDYASRVASSLGIGLDQNFSAAQLNDPSFLQKLGGAIAQQEGASSVYNPSQSTAQSLWTSVTDQMAHWENYILHGPAGDASGGQTTANAGDKPATGLFGPLINWFNGLVKGVEGGIQNTLTRSAFIIIGLLLLAAGIFYVASQNKGVTVAA